jgi:hypothetical protein
MAFDQPLEADQVNDLSIFSTLVRAPVAGIIMWVLGGDKAREEDERLQERQRVSHQLLDSDKERPVFKMKKCHSQLSGLKSGGPSLDGSDVSDTGECALSIGSFDCLRLLNSHHSFEPSRAKLKKQLSWSDGSGKNLVQYDDEVSDGDITMRCVRWASMVYRLIITRQAGRSF